MTDSPCIRCSSRRSCRELCDEVLAMIPPEIEDAIDDRTARVRSPRGTVPLLDADIVTAPDDDDDGGNMNLNELQQSVTDSHLAALSPRLRELVLLVVAGGRTVADAAAELGVTEQTAARYVRRLRETTGKRPRRKAADVYDMANEDENARMRRLSGSPVRRNA